MNDTSAYIITIFLLLWGYFSYKNKYPKIKNKFYWYSVVWIWIAVFISSVLCLIYEGQGFFQSFITCRGMYIFMAIPILLTVRPTEKQVITALTYFCAFYGFLVIVEFFLGIQITVLTKEDVIFKKFDSSNSITKFNNVMYDGVQFLAIPMFFYICKYKQKQNFKSLIKGLCIYFLIFMAQNRSLLIPCTILIGYVLITVETKYKLLFRMISVIVMVYVFIHYFADAYHQITDQTIREINNADYQRNISWAYFLEGGQHSFLTRIFGNGNKTMSLPEDVMPSDVGFVSVYYFYGIIPIIVYLYYLIKGVISKDIPLYIKLTSLVIMCGIPTTSWFMGNYPHTWFFILYIYLYIYNKENLKSTFSHRRLPIKC